MSPPKKNRQSDADDHYPVMGSFSTKPGAQAQSAKSTAMPPVRSSAAAIARKSSYTRLHPKGSGKPSPYKENQAPYRAQETLGSLGSSAYPGRAHTPHPFVVPQAQMGRWDSDISMRDTSSVLSYLSR